ncbi:ribosomal protein S12 methylthiotransferase [Parabacteroides sp. PF5-5]|uniref:30S ribosomal protein S12 methylthiotransferase RimO n=1 Tax=unclassified Parabacteroides TaxID=2649774 RepID=UPI002473D388|nr:MULTISPECIES: 30S ribosomal protein S12 methylthiotransferase RimO [unclassified Parabacteroides]MDH6303832.1 ribosomal protein S12 methylthiotransferase [Parabacteroides sp. PH5-39]MDH6314449.1 ribosomal protein S12 methylthiotransferase [Parabacteroides sp. PF5-13]MDH6318486.1 ribosomal protein S12 methylthiotransferase [Parabacteroides sp. PH5-13]MDH6322221.1 ribosomal protein S12 methylthiotransferase [Parabacteroides sp. PH5-8]MDH6325699.1 ribosomal protein S12 methylthiotransferase [P
MKKNKVDIITLGCSKNLVDSEQLMRQFAANGYTVKHDPEKVTGEIVVVNTCGFIGDAQEESINMILELGEAKKKGKIAQLYVMGCLSERFLKELKTELPEVDKFYGKFNWKELLTDLGKTYHQELATDRILTTPSHYAYLKIAEGCNRTCSYCSIPIMTGRYQSRPIEDIEEEVRILAAQGVKEFQVIAQDLTYYGLDKYKQLALPQLIERLSDIKGVEWLRLHYAYPARFPYDLLRVMRERENVCNYLDIALQHISDRMLKLMRRNITKDETYQLLERLREEVPGICLRTTLMVGHPGETDQDFEELVDFVKKVRFERMGAFAYSHEQGTYSYSHYKDEIPAEVKQERLDYIMRIQENIAAEINAQKVGNTYKVVIDKEEDEYYIGRTEFDSPEVDQEVLIPKEKPLKIGSFYSVKIDKTDIFDLYGTTMKS